MRDASGIMPTKWMTHLVVWYGVWLIMAGWSPSNAAAGVPAAALAAWAGVILLPGDGRRLAPLRVARFALGFLWQSVTAGVDVAWRVFQPKMPLQPGIVKVAPRLPDGLPRLLFRGIASLQPGSLACGVDVDGNLMFHCLDTRDDVQGALSQTEDELAKMWKENQA